VADYTHTLTDRQSQTATNNVNTVSTQWQTTLTHSQTDSLRQQQTMLIQSALSGRLHWHSQTDSHRQQETQTRIKAESTRQTASWTSMFNVSNNITNSTCASPYVTYCNIYQYSKISEFIHECSLVLSTASDQCSQIRISAECWLVPTGGWVLTGTE